MGPRQRPHAARDSCYLVEGLTAGLAESLFLLSIVRMKSDVSIWPNGEAT